MSSAYQNEGELELGLGLSLHTGSCSKNNDTQWGGEHVKKIKTAKDSVASQGDYSASPPAVRYMFACLFNACLCWKSCFFYMFFHVLCGICSWFLCVNWIS